MRFLKNNCYCFPHKANILSAQASFFLSRKSASLAERLYDRKFRGICYHKNTLGFTSKGALHGSTFSFSHGFFPALTRPTETLRSFIIPRVQLRSGFHVSLHRRFTPIPSSLNADDTLLVPSQSFSYTKSFTLIKDNTIILKVQVTNEYIL